MSLAKRVRARMSQTKRVGGRMSLANRLTKIETSLTPKQAVLFWLKEVRQSDPDEYREKALRAPFRESPQVRIPQMAEDAVRNALRRKGWTWESASRPAFEAWKEACFLLDLVHQLNLEVRLDELHSRPDLMFLLVELAWMEQEHEEHGLITALGGWRTLFIKTLTGMLLLKTTIQAISKQYYDNHSILFPDEEAALKLGIGCAEDLATGYNALEGLLPSWTAIDLPALKSSIEAEIPAAVGEQVARAKAKTLRAIGEWEAAWEIVQPYALAEIEKLRPSRPKSEVPDERASKYPGEVTVAKPVLPDEQASKYPGEVPVAESTVPDEQASKYPGEVPVAESAVPDEQASKYPGEVPVAEPAVPDEQASQYPGEVPVAKSAVSDEQASKFPGEVPVAESTVPDGQASKYAGEVLVADSPKPRKGSPVSRQRPDTRWWRNRRRMMAGQTKEPGQQPFYDPRTWRPRA
jgi:hypothetical protein